MCQRSAQPSSCRNQSDLFRSAVQHGDGCRRRLSIRQTRSPKQARGFWCLFLKKARPICDGAPRPRSPRSFSPSFAPCRPPDAPHTSPPQPEIPFPRHSDSTSSPTPAVSAAPITGPPSCVSRSLFPARPMRAARNGTANSLAPAAHDHSIPQFTLPRPSPKTAVGTPAARTQAALAAGRNFAYTVG